MNRRMLLLALPLAWACASAEAGWRDWLDSARDTLDGSGDSGDPAAAGITDAEVADGLRAALVQGAERAVDTLGREGGFLDDPRVRIGIPEPLTPVARTLRAVGQGERVEAFERRLNRAAEAAVPAAREVVVAGIRGMTLADARGILQGGDTAATDYLRRTGGDRIRERMRPLVEEATREAEVTRYYKAVHEQAEKFAGGVVDLEGLDIDAHVTEQATEALFRLIAEEERRIREDPVARGSELLQRVFGGG